METKHPNIPPVELQSLLANGCCLVDVREPVEHAEAHIAGARLIPLGQLEQRITEIDRSCPVVVMCQGGKRGAEAREKLTKLGLSDVRNLNGGILAWKSAGLPVTASTRKVLPLMRQVQLTIGLGVLTGVALAKLVHPNFIYLSAFFGAGLVFAGSTGWCGLAILMAKMPWNRVPGHACCARENCG
ncbi:MAG: rhodanese-like domain-containing protein [Verrucomicrobiota bacterium]